MLSVPSAGGGFAGPGKAPIHSESVFPEKRLPVNRPVLPRADAAGHAGAVVNGFNIDMGEPARPAY